MRRSLVVTGLSGAGKTNVLKHLEDSGYFCIDNLPSMLLGPALSLCDKAEDGRPFALVADTRGGELFDPQQVLEELENHPGISLLFLEADDETLIDRYKETRREHPLFGKSSTLEGAIALERGLLQPLRERANYILTTRGLRLQELRAKLDALLGAEDAQQSLRTEIMSFGYKRGIPRESDLVFDVRFLPNPFYIKEIRCYTGLEAPVRDYVLGFDETREFLSRMTALVDYLIPLYKREGKRRLMIAVGCTGGAHRSVAISEALGRHLRDNGVPVNVHHRDIAIEEASWPFRRTEK